MSQKKEFDRVLGHAADNDGIDEYDNPLPGWWLGMFAISVVWGVAYATDYHLVSERSQAASYASEMQAAAERWPTKAVDASAASVTPEAIEAGKQIYATNCVACHGAELLGGIGPNLVDAEWIHGGELADIVKTVHDGVPEKGMVSWGPVLGPEKVQQVSAYVYAQGRK